MCRERERERERERVTYENFVTSGFSYEFSFGVEGDAATRGFGSGTVGVLTGANPRDAVS